MDTASAQDIAKLDAERNAHVVEVGRRPSQSMTRQTWRAIKREVKHAGYTKAGLNGTAARARRARQAVTGHSDQFFGYRDPEHRVHANVGVAS